MVEDRINIGGVDYPYVAVNTLIIGSGVAALNAALCLYDRGIKDIAIVTEQWGGGTSNNAGSDKQTYYKLSIAGAKQDSPVEMAQDLYMGICMHGDIALCEAQHSAQAFYNLVKMGVPFPHDQYGGYHGYQTDHDQKGRATSAGPRTSQHMFQAMAKEVQKRGIPILNHFQIFKLLNFQIKETSKVVGSLAIDKTKTDLTTKGITIFNAVNVILGTGGPGGMYKSSVYPESQTGSTGLALEIGAKGQNLTESQFGIASTKFRWNLSGTYQQVIPRYISTDQDGKDEKEFLVEHFPSTGKLCDAIFLKGYQWPFDPRKIKNFGSSLIDLLVYFETEIKGRRVFLDFTKNPEGFSFDQLGKVPFEYLENSNALLDTPIDRLQKMNPLAIQLYKDNGINIEKERLEIAVCAQHNNGGLMGGIWWESNVKHLFPVGEVNGTHGVYRPGGSALNSGQVGGLRAAMFISENYDKQAPEKSDFLKLATKEIESALGKVDRMTQNASGLNSKYNVGKALNEMQERMSKFGGHIRDLNEAKRSAKKAKQLYEKLSKEMSLEGYSQLPGALKLLDFALTHWVYLEAISEYLEKGGKSRGSYLVADISEGNHIKDIVAGLELSDNNDFVNNHILEIGLGLDCEILKDWVKVRPIPDQKIWFEKMWQNFRERNIFMD